MPFISFSCLIALARTSSIMLNLSDKSKHPCVTPDLRGKTFSLSSLSVMIAVGSSYMTLIMLRKFFSVPGLLSVFIMKRCWILSNAFSMSIEMIMCFFFLLSTNVMY